LKYEQINIKDIDSTIPVSQKIMVYIEEGNFAGKYSSYIYDFDGESLLILIPTDDKGSKAVLRTNDNVHISFIAKNGKRLGFSSSIIKAEKDGNNTLYRVKKPTTILEMDLRDNFRVEVLMDTEFFYFNDGKIQKSKGTILDISAGGIKLSCEEELEVRSKIFLKLVLNDYILDGIEAEVVRIALIKDDKVKHYGLRFTNLDKEKEDRIIKFCINKQLEEIRKLRG
jgi:c-di-GMP-binding flagellar brake protein YcgR